MSRFTCRYSELRLIDIASLKESLPLTITDLKKNAYKATQHGVKRLMETWIPSCVKIISDRREDIEEYMPEEEVILTNLKFTLGVLLNTRTEWSTSGMQWSGMMLE